ncbi:fasciclin-2-like isoform X2 [Rhodnius prolixus]|uniref:fasciclin-2-like isoform X2 n=1 Tax=Rhodnius prolixus TaxID=13249 RepID=UPI003D18D81A
MVILLVAAFLSITTGAVLGGRLELIPSMNETERYEGDTYVVTCKGEDAVNSTWTGPNGKPIRETRGRKHVEDRKDGSSNSLSLIFESIIRADRGNYTCTSIINGGVVRVTFQLIVRKPISFEGSFSEQYVTENTNQKVRCEVSGDPTPAIVWQINNKHPKGNRYMTQPGGLYIENITQEDEGIYTCTAYQVTSKTSNFKSQNIRLFVLRKPKWPESNRSEGDISYGYKGGVANITCLALGKPFPEYSWSRFNQSLDPVTTSVVTYEEKSVLQVKMINDSVLGEYTCVARNGLGSATKVITLREGSRPRPPTRIHLHAVGVQSAQLKIFGPPKEQLVGYRIQFVKNIPSMSINNGDYQDVFVRDGQPFVIINLTENTEYIYRVATRNPAGLSIYSEEHFFRTRDASSSISNHPSIPSYLIGLLSILLLALRTR